MKHPGKTALSLLIWAVFGLTMTCDATANPDREELRTNSYVQPCIAKIGLHADYGNATRIVHRVSKLGSTNLAEMEVRIDTFVYGKSSDDALREYRSSCVVASLGSVIRFRMDRAG